MQSVFNPYKSGLSICATLIFFEMKTINLNRPSETSIVSPCACKRLELNWLQRTVVVNRVESDAIPISPQQKDPSIEDILIGRKTRVRIKWIVEVAKLPTDSSNLESPIQSLSSVPDSLTLNRWFKFEPEVGSSGTYLKFIEPVLWVLIK